MPLGADPASAAAGVFFTAGHAAEGAGDGIAVSPYIPKRGLKRANAYLAGRRETP
jgi:hypothetical protein